MMIEEQAMATERASEVRMQLAKIVGSLPFIRSARIGEFLTFVVENTIEGNHDVLKETCIGSMVFSRDATYDPKIDPIVRVEARRLRAKLQEYYDTEGKADTVLITLPKGGYRPLIEDRIPEPHALPLPEPVFPKSASFPPAVAPPPPRRMFLGAVLGVNALLIAAAGFWFFSHRHPSGQDSLPHPLTSYVGQEFDPAISPDGHHLAFVWDGNGSNYDIYVKSLPTGEPVRLTTNAATDLHPAWSPDGRDLAFLRVTPAGSQVVLVPSSGGPERVLGEVHNNVSVWKADASQIVGSLGPTWSPDGESLILDDGGALYLWPLAFGTRRQVTQPPEGSNDFFPAISPDGASVAFVRQTSNSTADLYLARLSDPPTTAPRRLTNDKSDFRGLTWSPAGDTLVFSSNRQGSYALWQIAINDGHLETFPANSSQAAHPSLSRGSSRLAYTELTQNTNIWQMPIAAGSHPAIGPAVRLISSSRRNNSPQYSPDGQQVVFISDRSGSWELWTCHADGSSPRQLTNFHGPLLGTPHWSPDGKWIAFDARPGEHSAIFLIDSNGGEPKLVSKNSFEERMPNWSADSRFLYFNSTRSGAVRLWKMDIHGENPTQITNRPAYDSFEAEDGSTIYFRGDGDGIWSVPASGGQETPVAALAHVQPSRYLAVTRDALYFVDRETAPRHLQAYNFASHKITTLGELDRALVSGTPSLSISPDGRSVIYAQQDESGSDIVSVPWHGKR